MVPWGYHVRGDFSWGGAVLIGGGVTSTGSWVDEVEIETGRHLTARWYSWKSEGIKRGNLREKKRSRGGLKSILTFLLFLIEGNGSYQELFIYRMKNILFLVKVIALSNLKNTYNYIAHAKFNRDSRKLTSKSISSYIFYDKPLQLGSYVLWANIKLLSGQILDLGLRCENIEF